MANKNLWTNFKVLGSLIFVIILVLYVHISFLVIAVGIYGFLVAFHLKTVFRPYLAQFEEDTEAFADEDPDIIKKRNLLKMSIDELELSVRSYNCLTDAKVKTIGELARKKESEMLKFRNFGKKSLAELNKVLKEKSLEFGMDVDKYLNDSQGKKKK
jgi:DNA-directed RNA polymerase alpha subunit